MDNKAFDVHQC